MVSSSEKKAVVRHLGCDDTVIIGFRVPLEEGERQADIKYNKNREQFWRLF